MSLEEVVRWVLSVDRRYLALTAFIDKPVLKPSEVAQKTNRSVQNINRAFRELEKRGLVENITPGKHSWNKYMLTDSGKDALERLLKKLEEKSIAGAA
jgi:predicted transcriptional regulator